MGYWEPSGSVFPSTAVGICMCFVQLTYLSVIMYICISIIIYSQIFLHLSANAQPPTHALVCDVNIFWVREHLGRW